MCDLAPDVDREHRHSMAPGSYCVRYPDASPEVGERVETMVEVSGQLSNQSTREQISAIWSTIRHFD
ncbi:MAG: hypothetical protein ABSB99_10695 [Acidimicrobiales bacterium]|jgi:hypothetical protein